MSIDSHAGGLCICLQRKCALARSLLRIWRIASSVGWTWREAMALLSEGSWGDCLAGSVKGYDHVDVR